MTLVKEEPAQTENIDNFSETIQSVKYSSGYKASETTKAWVSSPYQSYQDLKSGKGLLIFQKLAEISKHFFFLLNYKYSFL